MRLSPCLKIISSTCICCGLGRKGITLLSRVRIEYRLEIRRIGSRNLSMSDRSTAPRLFDDDLAQECPECIAHLNAHLLD
jgi:hypothetical protein